MCPKMHKRILGCKVSYADTQALGEVLAGRQESPTALVGTCCVTAEGEKQSRKEVRRAVRLVGPEGRVFVTGCAVRYNPEPFREIGDNVVVVEGGPDDAAAKIAGMAGLVEETSVADANAVESAERTRTFIKVQDGCANKCAYCVIPLIRGRPRSFPAGQILDRAATMLKGGCPELVLSGINLGAYRDGGIGLPELVETLAGLDGLKRLRLSSLEAIHVDGGLLEVMGKHDNICSHLHIPLQSGDDAILKSMGRRYGTLLFAERIKQARTLLPGLNLTTDVIVGFPGEDDEAFGNTMAFVEEAGFTKVHVFTYSPRPGTAAAEMGDPVPAPVKKERSRLLRGLSDRLGACHREGKLGQTDEILLESSVEPGVYAGYSGDYTRYVMVSGQGGKLVSAVGERVMGDSLWGKVVGDE